jgi:uncharacterized membrane protein
MASGNFSEPGNGSPIFSAVLRPHRSLSARGFAVVMLLVVAGSFTISFVFWLRGAWPVVGFFGLDIFLVQLAFRMSYRQARAAEEYRLTQGHLSVRRTTPSGRSTEVAFNPYWARLEIDRHPEFGVTGLRIASHGSRLDIARFLGPRERERFAEALGAALAQVRAAPA